MKAVGGWLFAGIIFLITAAFLLWAGIISIDNFSKMSPDQRWLTGCFIVAVAFFGYRIDRLEKALAAAQNEIAELRGHRGSSDDY